MDLTSVASKKSALFVEIFMKPVAVWFSSKAPFMAIHAHNTVTQGAGASPAPTGLIDPYAVCFLAVGCLAAFCGYKAYTYIKPMITTSLETHLVPIPGTDYELPIRMVVEEHPIRAVVETWSFIDLGKTLMLETYSFFYAVDYSSLHLTCFIIQNYGALSDSFVKVLYHPALSVFGG